MGVDAGRMRAEVVVVGGGLAGLATAIHLARSSREVVCIEPRAWPRDSVGESFDLSTPQLLSDLGLPRESLFASDIGVESERSNSWCRGWDGSRAGPRSGSAARRSGRR